MYAFDNGDNNIDIFHTGLLTYNGITIDCRHPLFLCFLKQKCTVKGGFFKPIGSYEFGETR